MERALGLGLGVGLGCRKVWMFGPNLISIPLPRVSVPIQIRPLLARREVGAGDIFLIREGEITKMVKPMPKRVIPEPILVDPLPKKVIPKPKGKGVLEIIKGICVKLMVWSLIGAGSLFWGVSAICTWQISYTEPTITPTMSSTSSLSSSFSSVECMCCCNNMSRSPHCMQRCQCEYCLRSEREVIFPVFLMYTAFFAIIFGYAIPEISKYVAERDRKDRAQWESKDSGEVAIRQKRKTKMLTSSKRKTKMLTSSKRKTKMLTSSSNLPTDGTIPFVSDNE